MINILIDIYCVIASIFVVGFIILFISAICSKPEKVDGYHSEAMDSQGGVLWVSDTDPDDFFGYRS